MDAPYFDEIYHIMGQLKDKMYEQISISGAIQPRMFEGVESDHFIGSYTHFDPSGGRLIPEENLIDGSGNAVIKQGLRFEIAIRPKDVENAKPLRYEVDNHFRYGKDRIIHINDAAGEHYPITTKMIEEICPNYTFDLVQVSSMTTSVEAIKRSIEVWKRQGLEL